MSMRALEDLREMLCDELDEIAKKQEMSAGDLETIHKLTDTIKNIDKIIIMDEDGAIARPETGRWRAVAIMGAEAATQAVASIM